MKFDELIKSLQIQPELNNTIWDGNKLRPQIRAALIRVAKIFYDSLKLENKPKLKDIVFTGSLANYNYSKMSDIDLHLIFDYGSVNKDEDMVSQFFSLAKANWNDQHDITIKGYEVEVYAEDEDNPHVATGLYSIMNDKWIKEPHKEQPLFDIQDVRTKIQYFIHMYQHLVDEYRAGNMQELYQQITLLRDKIGKFRQGGLSTGGIFSTENIAFKLMRRSGLLHKLKLLQNRVLDKQLSVETQYGKREQVGNSSTNI